MVRRMLGVLGYMFMGWAGILTALTLIDLILKETTWYSIDGVVMSAVGVTVLLALSMLCFVLREVYEYYTVIAPTRPHITVNMRYGPSSAASQPVQKATAIRKVGV